MYDTTFTGHLIEAATLFAVLLVLAVPCFFEARRRRKETKAEINRPFGATRV